MARRASRASLALLGTLLSVAVGCGPQVGGGSTEADGGSCGTADDGTAGSASTSTVGEESSTSTHVAQCGDGVQDEGEWCFERLSVDIAELGLEQAFRVIATPDGLVVWGDNGFSLLSVDGDTPAFANEPFYERAYGAGFVMFLAKLTTLGVGRPDLIFWKPVEVSPEIDPSLKCQRVFLSPGASRPEPGSDFGFWEIQDIDCSRDDLVAPLKVDDSAMDLLFTFDRNSSTGAVFRPLIQEDDRPDGFRVELAEALDIELPCPPAAIHTGDFNGDGLEDGVLLAPQCPATEGATLYTFLGESNLPLNPEANALTLPLQAETFTLQVADHNADGFADLLIAEPGTLLLLAGSPEGLSASQALPTSPVEVVIEGPAHIEDSERPILTLATGQLDTGSELEVLTSTDAGITAVSPESGVLGEFPDAAGSFAAFDINADGVSDVALIVDQQVVVYRSNP